MATAKYLKIKGFTKEHINDELMKLILAKIDPQADLKKWSQVSMDNLIGGFVGMSTVSNTSGRIIGHMAFNLEYTTPSCCEPFDYCLLRKKQKTIVLKSKSRGCEALEYLLSSDVCDRPELASQWRQCCRSFGMEYVDYRELLCVSNEDHLLRSLMPDIYWSWIDDNNDVFVFAMEYIDPKNFTMTPPVDNGIWSDKDILTTMHGMAIIHSRYYGNIDSIPNNLTRYAKHITKQVTMPDVEMLQQILEEVHRTCPIIINDEAMTLGNNILNKLSVIFDKIEESPYCLLHYDIAPRNMCFRKQVSDGKHRLCLYDWEFASIGCPLFDVSVFLPFVVSVDTIGSPSKINAYLKAYASYMKTELSSKWPDFTKENLCFEKVLLYFDMCFLANYVTRHSTFISMLYRRYQWEAWPEVLHNMLVYLRVIMGRYEFLM